jgi:hypothetical protein
LVVLIDNALQHVGGTQAGENLETIRKILIDLYGEMHCA